MKRLNIILAALCLVTATACSLYAAGEDVKKKDYLQEITQGLEPLAADTVTERALREVESLKTWDDLYRMFKRHEKDSIDDGAIAEGYSDAVGRFFLNDWKRVRRLKKICDSDPAFERFIYRHLDISIPADVWEVMVNNATNKCTVETKRICKLILRANAEIAREAIGNESNGQEQSGK